MGLRLLTAGFSSLQIGQTLSMYTRRLGIKISLTVAAGLLDIFAALFLPFHRGFVPSRHAETTAESVLCPKGVENDPQDGEHADSRQAPDEPSG